MRKKVFIFVSCIVVKILLHSSEWTTISPGVEYRKFTLSDPNDVYVVRIKRNTPNLVLDVGVGGATIRDIREPVSKIVARYQNIVNYDGECYTILAAINGDFFSYTTDQVIGGQVIAGSYVDKMGPRGKYVYCKDNSMWIEKIVSFSAVVTFVDGSTETINNINVPRGTNELILYTHHYDYSTFTTGEGCEVVVNEVVEPLRPNKEIVGRIKEVRTEGQTPALIPFDGFVLSASGIKKDMLKLKSKVGDIIKVKIIVESNLGYDWSKAYSAIEGAQWFVSNGQLTSDLWEERHPRTAVAYNNDYIYLIVCDGRRSTSLGMKLSDLGNFCIQYLQATEALNLDCGGSSPMWVNGEVKNKPSDGTERAVANALFVAKLTVDKNTRFKNNDQIKIIS
ncbi:MAG: phosphodiester glycosidase family protein, partial [Endomicrobia bacterium]|nr:phosphodiester glycosidase family protein [Endomicrobiia bacterium]